MVSLDWGFALEEMARRAAVHAHFQHFMHTPPPAQLSTPAAKLNAPAPTRCCALRFKFAGGALGQQMLNAPFPSSCLAENRAMHHYQIASAPLLLPPGRKVAGLGRTHKKAGRAVELRPAAESCSVAGSQSQYKA
jgi:hypothetical protein